MRKSVMLSTFDSQSKAACITAVCRQRNIDMPGNCTRGLERLNLLRRQLYVTTTTLPKATRERLN